MKGKKDDRRVIYTKMVLRESLIKLLEKKNISQIYVKEICEIADINRGTFYAHYNDQFDLLNKIQDDLFENIKMHLSAYTNDDIHTPPVDMVEKIFEYIKENSKLCKLLLSDGGDLKFQKRVLTLVYEKSINEITKNSSISKEDAEYIHAFQLTGCLGIIQKWLDDDMKKSPYFIAETIIKLTTGLTELIRH
ncbi:TetR/AcrR family transcriptional regulator [Alkalibaculum sporogenes]|nr:TetR/AcrR family transcriptional regulator [Alkalibaculum sporogenes]